MMNSNLIVVGKTFFNKLKSSIAYYVTGIYNRIGEHNVFLMGGGLTFSFATCIIPFVLILFAILGSLLEIPEIELKITSFIDNAIPYQESSEFVKSIVIERINELQEFKTLAGYLGAIGLFFAASGLVSSLRTILNEVFQVRQGRNIFIAKLRDIGIVLLFIAVFLLSIVLIPVIEIVRNLTSKIWFLSTLELGFLKQLFLSLVSFSIILGIFYFIYFIIPYRKRKKKALFVSALWATLLWELAKQIFGLYLAYSANLSRIYGAYVFVVAVILWLYYSSVVIIMGAEIGQLYFERNQNKKKLKKTEYNEVKS